MNKAQKRVIEREIGNLEDDVIRAKMEMGRTGKTQELSDYIAQREQRIAELKET